MKDGQMTFFDDAPRAAGKPIRCQIRRSFQASIESVFDAWLIPYLAGSWIFGPKTLNQEIVTLENKPLPGGSFLLEVVRDGQRQRLTGVYREIRRPEKLQCTIGQDMNSAPLTTLTMELADDNGKARMKLSLELDASLADDAEAIKAEWTTRCKSLAERIERPASQRRLID